MEASFAKSNPDSRVAPLARVGFVGLGQMGEPMAARLAEAGFPLAVHDLRMEATEDFARRTGALARASATEVATDCETVITMLPDGAAVADAVLGNKRHWGIAAALAPGSLVVDMSSSAPAETRELGAELAELGIRMVDAPVSGGVARARAGTLTIMAGGDAEDTASCEPLFAAIGERIFQTGGLGTGHAVKALNNSVSAAGLIAAAEALIVGRRAGVEPEVLLDVLNASTGRNNATENKLAQFVLSRSFDSGFALRLMSKDVDIAATVAADLGIETVLLGELAAIVDAADRQLEGGADHTAIARWLEERAGVAALSRQTETAVHQTEE